MITSLPGSDPARHARIRAHMERIKSYLMLYPQEPIDPARAWIRSAH